MTHVAKILQTSATLPATVPYYDTIAGMQHGLVQDCSQSVKKAWRFRSDLEEYSRERIEPETLLMFRPYLVDYMFLRQLNFGVGPEWQAKKKKKEFKFVGVVAKIGGANRNRAR